MTLKAKKVKLRNKEVKKIYVDSFIKEERLPFLLMVILSKITSTDFLAFYDKNELCGFIYMATSNKITFVMFFAIDKNIRSKGYGSQILSEISRLYPDNKIIISIERCDVSAEDIEERIRRKKFYLKNGYNETDYLITLSNVEQEIIIKNGIFDKEEFAKFLRDYSNGTMKPRIWKK